jgi:orotate phosphoribosyltransferase
VVQLPALAGVVKPTAFDQNARQTLLSELRRHALVIGDVTLTSGRKAQYYVDAKRALLRRDGFTALGDLVGYAASELGAEAVGGMTMGADPIACACLRAGTPQVAFFVRKERKEHGLQRWLEGPQLDPGTRCLIVEDVVTSGASAIRAIERVQSEGLYVCGVLVVVDRLAGAREAIAGVTDAPYIALATIDDIYPQRPDR